MVNLTRPDGNWAGDLDLTRRSIAMALAGGYAVAAFDANAEPIHTDDVGLVTATVEIDAGDRKIPGYLARPTLKGRHPVVFVYTEIFGVHEWIKDICRRLAKAGYVALAPDFFVRNGDPSKLTDFPEIMKIVGATPDAQVTSDTAAALKFLKAQPFGDLKRLGVTGFCWGGGKTWLAAERFAEFKAGVAWYGPLARNAYPQTPPIELAKDLHAPVLGLYGGLDKGIPQTDVDAMKAALKAAGKTGSDIVVYPNAQHGFLADYRPSYGAVDAAAGWALMLAHFKKNGVG
ncbi:dienelactone hydrolase family protein [Phenylobacterium sp.]|uniref:dienelactone hydrolase family protein n=1 Tax=Phenylobacterium sp. TaxID=1871053 RepID=UPI0025FBBF1F|nr:dienelactone hydrolase family protein [Phenylobacterium sp.]